MSSQRHTEPLDVHLIPRHEGARAVFVQKGRST